MGTVAHLICNLRFGARQSVDGQPISSSVSGPDEFVTTGVHVRSHNGPPVRQEPIHEKRIVALNTLPADRCGCPNPYWLHASKQVKVEAEVARRPTFLTFNLPPPMVVGKS